MTRLRSEDERTFANEAILTHVALLPFLLAMLTWLVMEAGRWSATSIFRVPIPFFTVPYECYLKVKHYGIMARPGRDDSMKNRKQFEEDKAASLKRMDTHENIVNLAKILESAVESGFQFFFQSVFTLPSLIQSLTAPWTSLTQFVNWRMASIFISFTSFAMTYYNIRYDQFIISSLVD